MDFTLIIRDTNEGDGILKRWTIEATGHRKKHISFDFAPFIEIKEDHPLLWEFTDVQCQLYFTGHCQDVPKLFYELYTTHKKTFGKYQNFNIYFGGDKFNYITSLRYSNGLLAEGSRKLMDKYADCLKQNGGRTRQIAVP